MCELYMRRTKIIATVGPASDDDRSLDGLIAAGVDIFRLNFSHGSADIGIVTDHFRYDVARSLQCFGDIGHLVVVAVHRFSRDEATHRQLHVLLASRILNGASFQTGKMLERAVRNTAGKMTFQKHLLIL